MGVTTVEARQSDLRIRLRDNNELIRNLVRHRQSLIRTLNQQTFGLWQGQLASAKAALAASTHPKEVKLKHMQLVGQALRDENPSEIGKGAATSPDRASQTRRSLGADFQADPARCPCHNRQVAIYGFRPARRKHRRLRSAQVCRKSAGHPSHSTWFAVGMAGPCRSRSKWSLTRGILSAHACSALL